MFTKLTLPLLQRFSAASATRPAAMIRTEFQNGNLLDPTAKEAVKKSERRVLKKIQTHQPFPGSATSLR